METNLIGYYRIDSKIFIAVRDNRRIKMISMIRYVPDENESVRIFFSTKSKFYILIFIK